MNMHKMIKIETKKVIAREFLFIILLLILSFISYSSVFIYNLYLEKKGNGISEELKIKESNLQEYKKLERLQLLHSALVSDTIFVEYTPVKFKDFILYFSNYEHKLKLFKAIRSDIVFSQIMPSTFDSAIKQYSFPKIYLSNTDTGYNETNFEQTDNLLKKSIAKLENDRIKCRIDHVSEFEQNKFTLNVFYFFVVILFILRYIYYGIKWSFRVLKNDLS